MLKRDYPRKKTLSSIWGNNSFWYRYRSSSQTNNYYYKNDLEMFYVGYFNLKNIYPPSMYLWYLVVTFVFHLIQPEKKTLVKNNSLLTFNNEGSWHVLPNYCKDMEVVCQRDFYLLTTVGKD